VDQLLAAATLPMRNVETGLAEPDNSAMILPDPLDENKLWVGLYKLNAVDP
jgi:hypothetical protein